VAYELYLLPVPPGADVEDEGEALLARLCRFEEVPVAPASLPEAEGIADALARGGAELVPARPRVAEAGPSPALPVLVLRADGGSEVTVARGFLRVRVPFEHFGQAATAVFDGVFRLLGAAVDATGWTAYDPQDAATVALDDDGRERTLLIYLTAMDHMRPRAM
jgi:hypothetical protein